MTPCLLPSNFIDLTLEHKADVLHLCHERLLEDFAYCRARHAELTSWAKRRATAMKLSPLKNPP
jgi:hypothetical protein